MSMAAQTEGEPDPVPVDTIIVVPFSTTEIPSQSEQANTLSREIRAEIRTDAYTLIRDELDVLKALVDSHALHIDSTELINQPLRTLASNLNRWHSYEKSMRQIESSLLNISGSLYDRRDEVSLLRSRWTITRTQADSTTLEALGDRIDSKIGLLDTLQREIDDSLKGVLFSQGEVAEYLTVVAEKVEDLQVINDLQESKIFTRDSPLLWNDKRSSSDTSNLIGHIAAAVSDATQEWKDFYAAKYAERRIYNIVALLLLLLIVLLLNLYRDKWLTGERELQIAKFVVSRPFSAVIVLFVIVFTISHPQRPRLVETVILLTLVVPLVRLLPGLIDKRLSRPLILLPVVFLLYEMNVLIDGEIYYQRLIGLAQSVLLLVAIIVLYTPIGKTYRNIENPWWRIFVKMSPWYAFILVISILLNIYGSVRFANMLQNGVVVGIIAYFGLLAGFKVFQSLLIIILSTKFIRSLNTVKENYPKIKKWLANLLLIVGFILWIRATLKAFRIWDSFYAWMVEQINTPISFGNVSITISDVLTFFIIIIISFSTASIIKWAVEKEFSPKTKNQRGVLSAISMLVRYTIIVIGFVLAVGAAGIDLSTFGLLAGALGVGIGFGLQNLVANFVSGLILAFERPINVGDIVEVGLLKGNVTEIGVRASKVKTFDGAEVIVPNGDFIQSNVINWTLTDVRRRFEVRVPIKYGSDPHIVNSILVQVADDHPDVLKTPEPLALFEEFADDSMNFRLLIWTTSDWLIVRSDITLAINDELKKAGISIPYPQRDIHIKSIDERSREILSENVPKKPGRPKKSPDAADDLDSKEKGNA